MRYNGIREILDVYDDLIVNILLAKVNDYNHTMFNDIIETGLVLIGISIIGIMVFASNIILVLISIERMLLGVNIQLVMYSLYFNDIIGQVLSLIVLTVAAAESAIGLGIVVVYYRTRGGIELYNMNMIHG
jgi:NADH-quinone oxidoreductase subunit K